MTTGMAVHRGNPNNVVLLLPSSPPKAGPGMERRTIEQEVPILRSGLFDPNIGDREDFLPNPSISSLDECLSSLSALFPDISPEYVRGLHDSHDLQQDDNIIEALVDKVLGLNGNYPKSLPERQGGTGKRKRERSPSDMTPHELDNKFSSVNHFPISRRYINLSRKHLRNSFPFIPAGYIDSQLAKHQNCLFPTYKTLALQEDGFRTTTKRPFKRLGRLRKATSEADIIAEEKRLDLEESFALQDEIAAAKRLYEHLTAKTQFELGTSRAILISDGEIAGEELFECGCCFGEVPFLKLTQCLDGHLFCLECAKMNAETEIGQQRYNILCMDGSGCRKPFPMQETRRFCSERMLETLQTLEQKDALRQANIQDLTDCPFCDFAAITVPVEEDREFRCQNLDCMRVSCRLCQKETHIPMSCEERAKEDNLSLRRNVEEAMTEALLRKCGKCGLPYVKESGCNKITCSRCSTMNCYLCSKVIRDYQHFNDPSRGGKAGNCSLFDNTEERHQNEVRAAEEVAIAQIRAENPDITEEEMRIKLSKVVLDGERQKIEASQPPGLLYPPHQIGGFRAPQIPALGVPGHFVGEFPAPPIARIPAPIVPPFNIFQRVANMMPYHRQEVPFPMLGLGPNVIPQAPAALPNIMRPGPPALDNMNRPFANVELAPGPENLGFLDRKIGSGRRLSRGQRGHPYEFVPNNPPLGNVSSVIHPNNLREAAGEDNGAPRLQTGSPARVSRPTKILKRR